MPVHDWTRVDAGLFHAFHQGWTIAHDALMTERQEPPVAFTSHSQPFRLNHTNGMIAVISIRPSA